VVVVVVLMVQVRLLVVRVAVDHRMELLVYQINSLLELLQAEQ
tara:strand:+ start:143 stop:271 length:129 start_codon:yes stop_codon:yes gene_type:complete